MIDSFFCRTANFFCCRARRESWVFLILFMAVISVYTPVRNFEFTLFDDNIYVYENRYVQSGITREGLQWAFGLEDASYSTYWHPVTWLSHMIDAALFGVNKPGMHHVVNMIWHFINTVLLFTALRSFTGAPWKSALVALLFSLHPVNVNAVAWVAERKTLLSFFGGMLVLLAYGRYVRRRRFSDYMLTLFCFALSLMAKPALVCLPFVLLLLDYWPLARTAGLSDGSPLYVRAKHHAVLVLEKIPLLILSVAGILMAAGSMSVKQPLIGLDVVPGTLRWANMLVSYMRYISKFFFPVNLSVFYPFPSSVPMWKVFIAIVFLLTTTAAAYALRKNRPYLIVGWLWFLGSLVPVSGLLQSGLWPAMANRFAYFPYVGLLIMGIWGGADWGRLQKHPYLRAGTALLLLITLAGIGRQHCLHWRNSETLFRHAMEVTEEHSVIYNNLGIALLDQGRWKESIFYFCKALRMEPSDAGKYNNIGRALAEGGNIDQAIVYYRQALIYDPDSAKARTNLGSALMEQGSVKKGMAHLYRALSLDPDLFEAHYNLGVALFRQGKIVSAMKRYHKALDIHPGHLESNHNLGFALFELGDFAEAVIYFRRALEIRPNSRMLQQSLHTAEKMLIDRRPS